MKKILTFIGLLISFGAFSQVYVGANKVNTGPTAGAAAPAVFRLLVPADIPTLPAATKLSGQVPLTNGGTAVSLSDPGANRLWGWDDTDNSIGFWTIGSNLSYDHATHTLSASGGTITASNGLTKTGNDIALGGTLTGDVLIDAGANDFHIVGNTGDMRFDDGFNFFNSIYIAAQDELWLGTNNAGNIRFIGGGGLGYPIIEVSDDPHGIEYESEYPIGPHRKTLTHVAYVLGAKTYDGLQTFRDDYLILQDNGDLTKQANFQLSGISAGQTRTLTVPNANGTLALTTDIPNAWLLASGGTLTGDNTINANTRNFYYNATAAVDFIWQTAYGTSGQYGFGADSSGSVFLSTDEDGGTGKSQDFAIFPNGDVNFEIRGGTGNFYTKLAGTGFLNTYWDGVGTGLFRISDYATILLQPNVTTGTGSTAGVQLLANSLTTGNAFEQSSSSVTTGALHSVISTSTVVNHTAGAHGLFDLNSSGANSTSSKTVVGVSSVVANTGTTSKNIALYAEASGATTNLALQTVGSTFISNASGDTPTASTRLDVRGISGGNSLRVANQGNTLVSVLVTELGNVTLTSQNSSSILTLNNGATTLSGTSVSIISNGGGNALSLVSSGGGFTMASGSTTAATYNLQLTRTFAPTSGSVAHNLINNTATINQTGGANGLVTAFNGSVTVTAAVDVTGYKWNPITPSNITGTHLAFQSTSGNWAMEGSATVFTLGGGTTASELHFLEPSGSGSNYTAFKAVAQGANITYSLPPTVGAAGTVLTDVAGNGVLTWNVGGDVVGPGSSTDNAIARFDLTTGRLIQNSAAVLTDNGDVTLGTSAISGLRSITVASSDSNADLEIIPRGTGGNLRMSEAKTWFRQRALPYFSASTTGQTSVISSADIADGESVTLVVHVAGKDDDSNTGFGGTFIAIWTKAGGTLQKVGETGGTLTSDTGDTVTITSLDSAGAIALSLSTSGGAGNCSWSWFLQATYKKS